MQSKDSEIVWEEKPKLVEPIYKIEDRPAKWWESVLYGWQHTLVDISPFVLPLAVAAAIGMNASEQAQFINFCLFSMGIATIIQTTLGNRLPIIQGPSATLTGTLVPIARHFGASTMWGSVFIGGLVEMLIGASRILKYLRLFFPPVVSGVVVICIGLSLGHLAVRLTIGNGQAINFLFAMLVIGCIFILQVLCKNLLKGIVARGAIFFSIWLVGLLLAGILGKVDWVLVAQKPWFSLPGFFPYGGPGFGWKFVWAAIFGVMAGYLGSMVESLGDYAATCAVSGEVYRVRHMNRGIFAEGLGCVVASILGGLPCTSYTQNIGIIATTRVASRLVVQIAALILMLYGLCPKFGALLVAMPRSVLGGIFIIVCGMIVMSGLRLVQVAKDTTANQLIIGTTLISAVGIPVYTQYVLGQAWLAQLPAFLRLMLSNTVVLAVLLSIALNILLNHLFKGES